MQAADMHVMAMGMFPFRSLTLFTVTIHSIICTSIKVSDAAELPAHAIRGASSALATASGEPGTSGTK